MPFVHPYCAYATLIVIESQIKLPIRITTLQISNAFFYFAVFLCRSYSRIQDCFVHSNCCLQQISKIAQMPFFHPCCAHVMPIVIESQIKIAHSNCHFSGSQIPFFIFAVYRFYSRIQDCFVHSNCRLQHISKTTRAFFILIVSIPH